MSRKILLIFSLFFLAVSQLIAQKEHFVYLQTENMQPFYVIMKGKTISSTSAGYIILPKLKDSTYPVKLGLAGSAEVQDYGIAVSGKNSGYLVKKSETQGWAIEDLQSHSIQRSMEWSGALAAEKARQEALVVEKARQDSIALAEQKKAYADSVALAEKQKAYDDSVAVAKTEQARADSVSNAAKAAATVVGAGTVAAVTQSVPAKDSVKTEQSPETKTDTTGNANTQKDKDSKPGAAVVTVAAATGAAVAVAGNAGGKEGNSEKKDSVSVNKETVATETGQTATQTAAGAAVVGGTVAVVASRDSVAKQTTPVPDTAKTQANPAFLDMAFAMQPDSLQQQKQVAMDSSKTTATKDSSNALNAAGKANSVVPAAAITTGVVLAANSQNSDSAKTAPVPDTVAAKSAPSKDSVEVKEKPAHQSCASLLSRDDVDNLMKQASNKTDLDAILKIYTDAFKSQCVTTTNLKKICSSLASDVSKYKLLEAAYPYTLDYYAYGELSSLLTDSYYITKFKSLIQQ